MSVYDEGSIYTPVRLEIVRNRPTQFFPSTGMEGLVLQATEIITNAIDELALLTYGLGKVIVMLCNDLDRQTYQLVVIDNGRGLPIGKLRDSFTLLNTSGKFNTKAYETSGGLFGVGAKATAGTSCHFRAITRAITNIQAGTASLYVHEGKDAPIELIDAMPDHTGVTIFYEPDSTLMTDVNLFSEVGTGQLISLIQKYCFFRRMNVEFRTHPLGLPADVWHKPLLEAEAIIHHYVASSHLAFSEENFDRTHWLRDYWGVQRPFALQHTIEDIVLSTDKDGKPITMRYEMRAYYVKFDLVGGRFGMVNNLPIDDFKSTHFITATDLIKVILSGHIKDSAVRKFFLDQYRVPLYLAVDVKYPGAAPAGTTKNAFLSKEFRTIYEPSLRSKFATESGVAFIAALYAELAADIDAKYMLAMTGVGKIKNTNRLFAELHYPEKFTDCDTSNRLSAELFLVEGDSAGGGSEGRDSDTQGMYALRGKPFNGIYSWGEARQSSIDIRKNWIYEDIITILNLNPSRFDPNTLNYGRIIIMTDADDHGFHISSIVVGNLYVLCPEIIEAGMLYIVTPPLYSLDYKNKRQKLPRVYLRNDDHLQIWLATNVYRRAFDVGVRLEGHSNKTYYLPEHDSIHFFRLVWAIGEAITSIAAELVLPPQVVEQLSRVTAHLDCEQGELNVERIKQILNFDRVTYDPNGHILILTVGREDYIVPLQNVRERLIQTVTPLLNLIKWKTTQIYITSKNTPQVFRDHPVSVIELHTLLTTLNDEFKIERYKGLGSMKPEDKARTCMDPTRRSIHRITTVGDIATIFSLLGSDSAPRKALLKRI